MSEHTQRPPIDVAREIARQAEVRLQAVLTLAIAQDSRATTLCGTFGAASIALIAAVLAYLGAEQHPVHELVVAGGVTASLLLIAACIAGWAGAPRDFWVAGGDPVALRSWAWDGQRWRDEIEMLDATAVRLAQDIKRDRELLESESRRVNCSLWVAAASIGCGLLAYGVGHFA